MDKTMAAVVAGINDAEKVDQLLEELIKEYVEGKQPEKPLQPRYMTLLKDIALGLGGAEAADKRGLSYEMVRTGRKRLYGILGIAGEGGAMMIQSELLAMSLERLSRSN